MNRPSASALKSSTSVGLIGSLDISTVLLTELTGDIGMRLASIVFAATLAMAAAPTLAAQGDTAPPNPQCMIKGNVNDHGDRIYHVPGDTWYARTKVDTSKGERWFCSEREAQAAGWRPPKK